MTNLANIRFEFFQNCVWTDVSFGDKLTAQVLPLVAGTGLKLFPKVVLAIPAGKSPSVAAW